MATYDLIADVYDSFIQPQDDIPFFLKMAERYPGYMLELMCGTGRVTIPLIKTGHPVTAVDVSSRMLKVLQRKLDEQNLQADVVEGDVRDLELARDYDLIVIPLHTFAELVNRHDREKALQKVANHLAVDGHFICTLYNPPVRRMIVDNRMNLKNRFDSENGHLLYWILQRYHDEVNNLVCKTRFFEEYDINGYLKTKRMLCNIFSLIEADEFENMVTEAGMEIEAVYGDYDESPFDPENSAHMIYVMKKCPDKF